MTADLAEIIAVLTRTPGTLRAMLGDLPEAWLTANEGADTFNARDVLGHLIDGEKTDWLPRIRLIRESGDRVPFAPFDRVAFKATIDSMTTEALLAEFADLRTAGLAELKSMNLTADSLALKGRHPALGEVTLGHLLATWAVHDLNHISQIVRVMSHRYADAVGPWKAYLGVLNR